MNFDSTLLKIRDRGHWHIHVFPNTTAPQEILVPTLHEAIKKCSVQFRGWDYPHIPAHSDEKQGMYVKNAGIDAWIDWEQFKEVWRVTTLGQFVHLFGLREDWFREKSYLDSNHYLNQIDPGTILDPIAVNYSMTEIYSFLRNLSELDFYKEGMNVEISLRNTFNRRLKILDQRRAPLFTQYPAMSEDIILSKKLYLRHDLQDAYLDHALNQTISILNAFDWINPPIDVLKQDQLNLLERKL